MAKKQVPKGRQGPPQPQSGSTASSIKLGKGELRIRFSDSQDLQDKLLSTAQSLSRAHTHMLLANSSGTDIQGGVLENATLTQSELGPQKAFAIVTGCANETDLTKKVGDIPALNPLIFISCVQDGVTAAGCTPGNIPGSSDTTLWDVVQAIEGSSCS